MAALATTEWRPMGTWPPARDSFGHVLERVRLQAGLSQNALAQRAGINASFVNRLESGDRKRPSDIVTLALAHGLNLDAADTDALLLAAGYAPTWLRYLGGQDSTVQALAAALTDDALDAGTLADIRACIEVILARFSGRVAPTGAPPRRLGRARVADGAGRGDM
jgi:transcriptional regulator with XRE-family HTH domain